MPLPDLATYTPHRTVLNAAFDGIPVPGLRAEFFHRTEQARVAWVCRYSIGGRDLLLTWGWDDEQRCHGWAVRDPSGRWISASGPVPASAL